MSDYIRLAKDQKYCCDECPKMAVVLTGGGAFLCGDCHSANEAMEQPTEDMCNFVFRVDAVANGDIDAVGRPKPDIDYVA